MSKIQSIFLKGLITLLPLVVTIYIIYSVIRMIENLIKVFLPETFYIPGSGLVITFALIFLFGLLLNKTIAATFLENLEKKLIEVPFIKAIYSPLRDLMNLFSNKKQKEGQKVVFVDLLGNGIRSLGIVTRDSFKDLPTLEHHMNGADPLVAVFVPFSYGLGGFTYLVPKSRLTEVHLPLEKAMSLAITGWVKAEDKVLDETELVSHE